MNAYLFHIIVANHNKATFSVDGKKITTRTGHSVTPIKDNEVTLYN